MKTLWLKLSGFFKSENKKVRIISFINKSIFRFLIKKYLGFRYKPSVEKRISAFGQQKLDEKQLKAVSHLNEFGYAIITDCIDPVLLKSLEDSANEKYQKSRELEASQSLTHKDFWVRLTDQEFETQLTTDNTFIQFALQESVLKLVGGYFQKIPFLEYVLLTLSKGKNAPLKSSQLWHLDYDNVGMLKLFVYLNDVTTDEQGPFTFIDKKNSSLIDTSVWDTHISDQKLLNFVSSEAITQMKHKKLSVFVVDTSKCYHMGSRLKEGHERLMFTALYLDLPSIYPWNGVKKIQANTMLSPIQQMTIDPL